MEIEHSKGERNWGIWHRLGTIYPVAKVNYAWVGVFSMYHRIHYDGLHRKCDHFSYELKPQFADLTSIPSGVSELDEPTYVWSNWHRPNLYISLPSSLICYSYLLESSELRLRGVYGRHVLLFSIRHHGVGKAYGSVLHEDLKGLVVATSLTEQ